MKSSSKKNFMLEKGLDISEDEINKVASFRILQSLNGIRLKPCIS